MLPIESTLYEDKQNIPRIHVLDSVYVNIQVRYDDSNPSIGH
jgi:hypothetical protein